MHILLILVSISGNIIQSADLPDRYLIHKKDLIKRNANNVLLKKKTETLPRVFLE